MLYLYPHGLCGLQDTQKHAAELLLLTRASAGYQKHKRSTALPSVSAIEEYLQSFVSEGWRHVCDFTDPVVHLVNEVARR